ncbi:ribbon-helix-helix protein, CopG family [Proteinivorax hydrogeniformans]|uniref:Ribbon-helix-helix protein, CopG family n=1 Tax=Proteinivorax hydrogeniformans TaxID=1826727 RepID=A0AAU8HT03_9FIRM
MAETREIVVSVPDNLLQELDALVGKENLDRSQLIREAVKLYICERQRRQLRDKLQRGYLEMSEINLSLANEAFDAENEAEKMVCGA